MKAFRTETDAMGEMSGLERAELEELFDLAKQTEPGLIGARK